MAREISHISIMVHPHYASGFLETTSTPIYAGRLRSVPPISRKLSSKVGDRPLAVNYLEQIEAMHQFYKRQIIRARKNPKEVLVIIGAKPSGFGWIGTPQDVPSAGALVSTAKTVVDHSYARQKSLQNAGRKRLGKRFISLDLDPGRLDHVALKVMLELRTRGFNLSDPSVEVFGETQSVCVADVKRSFIRAKFKTKVAESKSVD